MKIQFTQRNIDSLACKNPQGREFYRDTDCRGLCIEVRSTGGKTYYLSYRDARGAQRLYKLANAADVKPQQARQLCERARSKLAMGTDIAQQRQQLRTAPTVQQFFTNSYLPYVKSYKRSWTTDDSAFRNHVLPVIGALHMDEVSAQHVSMVMTTVTNNALADGTYNNILISMRYMFNLALRWRTTGMTTNPTAEQKLLKLSNHRERFLTAKETQLLLDSVNASSNRMLRYIVPMLLLTGARKQEVITARWRDMDMERSFWRIPVTKSGRERHVPLSAAALQLLERVPRRKGSEWVFANPKTLKPYTNIFTAWNTARTAAGLADVRMHDLRHSFASFLVNAGCSLYEVQKILGHASIAMTQRYSHLSQDSLLRAAEHAGSYVISPATASTPI